MFRTLSVVFALSGAVCFGFSPLATNNIRNNGGLSLSMSADSDKSQKTSIIAGATGYIGKSTVRESVRQGYNTIALVRDAKKVQSNEGKMLYGKYFEGAKIVECDVTDKDALTKVCPFFRFQITANLQQQSFISVYI